MNKEIQSICEKALMGYDKDISYLQSMTFIITNKDLYNNFIEEMKDFTIKKEYSKSVIIFKGISINIMYTDKTDETKEDILLIYSSNTSGIMPIVKTDETYVFQIPGSTEMLIIKNGLNDEMKKNLTEFFNLVNKQIKKQLKEDCLIDKDIHYNTYNMDIFNELGIIPTRTTKILDTNEIVYQFGILEYKKRKILIFASDSIKKIEAYIK